MPLRLFLAQDAEKERALTMDARDIRELTRALDRNTRATDALHALLLDIERTRRAEAAPNDISQTQENQH